MLVVQTDSHLFKRYKPSNHNKTKAIELNIWPYIRYKVEFNTNSCHR